MIGKIIKKRQSSILEKIKHTSKKSLIKNPDLANFSFKVEDDIIKKNIEKLKEL